MIVPGGPPAVPANGLLKNDKRVISLLASQMKEGRLVSAICAAPSVLAEAGLSATATLPTAAPLAPEARRCDGRAGAGVLEGKKHTAHFSVEQFVPAMDKAQAVVVDGNLITSQGAGTATQFGLALIAHLVSQKVADEVAASICWK